MHIDGHTFVTGGGTIGEGLQIWDLRKLDVPAKELTFSPGEVRNPKIEPLINAVRFIPKTKLIIVAATDAGHPAKIFNYLTGELVEKFYNKNSRATSCDVIQQDSSIISIGDAAGVTHLVNKEIRGASVR